VHFDKRIVGPLGPNVEGLDSANEAVHFGERIVGPLGPNLESLDSANEACTLASESCLRLKAVDSRDRRSCRPL